MCRCVCTNVAVIAARDALNTTSTPPPPPPFPAEEVLERDFFMSAAEARGFGLVDEVIERRPAAETEEIAAHAAADPARKWTFF